MKFTLIALSLVCTQALHAQDTGVKVSLDAVAAPAAKQLDLLSKASGVRLTCTPEMAREVLVLKLKDAVLATVMTKIADVTSGEWIADQQGYRLEVNRGKRNQEAFESLKMREALIAEQIKKLNEQALKVPVITERNADQFVKDSRGRASFGLTIGAGAGASFGFAASDPAGRAIVRLINLIGPRTIARIAKGDRVVFSSGPTRMQVPMPSGSSRVFDDLVAEQRYYALAKQRQQANEKPNDNGASNPQVQEMLKMMGLDQMTNPKPFDAPPAKALLIVTTDSIFGGISLELRLFDANGAVVGRGNQSLSTGGGMIQFSDALPGGQTKPADPKQDDDPTEIKLSKLSQERSQYGNFGAASMAQASAPIPEDLRQAMSSPDQIDPLSFAESEALLQIAARKNANLVADLPDGIMGGFRIAVGGNAEDGKLTVGKFLKRLKDSKIDLKTSDGFMTVVASDPVQAREERVDRTSLAQLVRQSARNGRISLDDLSTYALKNPEPSVTPAATGYFLMFAPDALQGGFGGRSNWDMLRLFATLPASTRSALGRGQTIRMPIQALTPQQAGYASRLLFGAGTRLTTDADRQKRADWPSIFDLPEMFGSSMDFRTEPTEVMPNGLPPQGLLTMDASREPIAQPVGNSMFGTATLGAEELGMLKFFSEMPQGQGMQMMMPQLNDVRIGQRTNYAFRFIVAQGISARYSLADSNVPKDGPVVSMGNLPSDFQASIEKNKQKMKNLPFFGPMFMGGGRVTPP